MYDGPADGGPAAAGPTDDDGPVPHDPSCVRCGHPVHRYLPCGDGCDCRPVPVPGDEQLDPDPVGLD